MQQNGMNFSNSKTRFSIELEINKGKLKTLIAGADFYSADGWHF
jgi:hypothetical protein